MNDRGTGNFSVLNEKEHSYIIYRDYRNFFSSFGLRCLLLTAMRLRAVVDQ
jgi:hypothetical protein